MRTVTYRLADLAKATIHIGKVAENEATRVQFDAAQIFAEYPAATPALNVINPAGTAYPAVVTKDGNYVIWDVQDSDLTAQGMGEFQLSFSENGVIIKSCVGRTRIERSIVANGEAPDPVQSWLDDAEEALAAIPNTIDTALAEAKASGEFDGPPGQDGRDGQDGAPGQDGVSPTVEVTEITGGHRVTITDAEGDHPFDVMDGEGGGAEIDDTAGEGDTDKVWSADKTAGEVSTLSSAIATIDHQLNGNPGGQSINLFNPNDPDILTGGYLDKSTGDFVSISGLFETGYIECEDNDTFTFYNGSGYFSSIGSRQFCIYNDQKQYIAGDAQNFPTITISNQDAKYFRIAVKDSENDNHIMIVKNDTSIHEYVPYGNTTTPGLADDVEALEQPCKGKKVVLLGDSIVTCNGNSSMKGWQYYLGQLGFSTITNKAHSGACMAYHSERQYEDVATTVDSVDFSTYDLVIIHAGVNDYHATSASPIGSLVNSVTATDFTKTDFIGAIQYIITKILTSKPGIKIALFTPLKENNFTNTNSQSKVLKDYADAIKTVADYYSIPVLDYYSMSGLNRMNFSTYLSDGTHPNEAGYKFISENKLTSFIANL